MEKLHKLLDNMLEANPDNTISDLIIKIKEKQLNLNELDFIILIGIGWHFGHLSAISNKITNSNLPINLYKFYKEK